MDEDTRPIPPSALASAQASDASSEDDLPDALSLRTPPDSAVAGQGGAASTPHAEGDDGHGHHRQTLSCGSAVSLNSECSEDDPRQVGLDNSLFGDYDIKKSPSTKDFVLSYIDDEMARRNLPGRLSSIANESLTDKKKKRSKGAVRHDEGEPSLDDFDTDGEDLVVTEDGSNEKQVSFPAFQESSGAQNSPKRANLKVPATNASSFDGATTSSDSATDTPLEGSAPAVRRAVPSHVAISYENGEDNESSQREWRRRVAQSQGAASMTQQVFRATGEVYMEGVESIVDDNFWKCFQSNKPRPWNWNAYLWPLWFLGAVFRYLVLFPIRLAIFASGWILFGVGMVLVQGFLPRGERRKRLEHKLISMMCGIFCITWGAVIRYHGSPVEPLPGEPHPVYVANHTSMIDVIILQQMRCFSLVGQRHKGIVRFLQEDVLGCLQCVWFDRGEIRDRAAVSRKLKEHATDPNVNPLLVFPEGTCVNNEYCIQFKKGIFEIGVPVLPVAIKYNKMFVDPFWNSRAQSFPMHLVELMTSWCLICDVWYLKPHVRRESESSEEFAGRVKKAIADKAGLINVNWDGYMKYWKPSERYLRARQQVFAESLRRIHKERKARDEKAKEEQDTRNKLIFSVPSFGELGQGQQQDSLVDNNSLRRRGMPQKSSSATH